MSNATATPTAPIEEGEFTGEVAGGVDAAEERARAGGLLPPGRYNAKLVGAARTTSATKGTPGWELVFEVQAGPFKGTKVKDTLYTTDNEKSIERRKVIANRLGVTQKSPDGKGYVPIQGKNDFMDVLDTLCVIEVKHEPDADDKTKHWLRLTMFGVWPLDHADVKKNPPTNGIGGSAKPAATQSAPKGDSKPSPEKKKVSRDTL